MNIERRLVHDSAILSTRYISYTFCTILLWHLKNSIYKIHVEEFS